MSDKKMKPLQKTESEEETLKRRDRHNSVSLYRLKETFRKLQERSAAALKKKGRDR